MLAPHHSTGQRQRVHYINKMKMITCNLRETVEYLRCALEDAIKGDPKADGLEIINKALQEYYSSLVNAYFRSEEGNQLGAHCTYSRSVRLLDQLIRFEVQRVKDEHGKTHAILLSFMIPYNWDLVDDYLAAITSCISDSENSYDYDVLRKMKQKYTRYWKRLIAVHEIPLNENIVAECFNKLSRQFMQIKTISNRLVTA